MEYLSRLLANLDLKNFKYHSKCKRIRLTHFMFADDLLLFCNADLASIRLIKQAFSMFSEASCLKANLAKSCVYLTGVCVLMSETVFSPYSIWRVVSPLLDI